MLMQIFAVIQMYVYIIMRKQSCKGFDFATDLTVDYFLFVIIHQQFQLPVQRSLFN